MKYARPPFPPALFSRFCSVAIKLGYTVRGHRWRLLELLLDYASEHPATFHNRDKKSRGDDFDYEHPGPPYGDARGRPSREHR